MRTWGKGVIAKSKCDPKKRGKLQLDAVVRNAVLNEVLVTVSDDNNVTNIDINLIKQVSFDPRKGTHFSKLLLL